MTMDPEPTPADEAPAEVAATPPPVPTVPEPVATPTPATVAGRTVGKTRNPWGVWGLSIITLGIYYLYWYYKVNEEVRDYDQSIEVEPLLSMLSQFVPIVGLVSFYKAGERIARTQNTAGAADACSPIAGLLLQMFVLSTGMVYYQSQLNKVWDRHGNPEPGTLV